MKVNKALSKSGAFVTIQHMLQTSMAASQLFTAHSALPKISHSTELTKYAKNTNSRRRIISSWASMAFISMLNPNATLALDFSLTVPDQTKEEAESVVKRHAQDLLQIKASIDSESWKEVQATIRGSSGYLKQDLYTIIQARPANERPLLRRLYSNLFNNVSQIDYAARRRDANAVKDCYDNVVAVLAQIFSKI